MNSLHHRLKVKMKELSLTQESLAKKLGVTRSAVAHYTQGTRNPPVGQIIKLAMILKTDPAWLQFGKSNVVDTKSAANQKYAKRIPIIEWHQVLTFNFLKPTEKYLDYFDYHAVKYYALQIKSDAMITSLGQGISFNQESYLIVQPDKAFSHGSFVLAVMNNKKEAIFRQYIEEGGQSYLKPLNPQYPLIQFSKQTKILGVIVANIYLLK